MAIKSIVSSQTAATMMSLQISAVFIAGSFGLSSAFGRSSNHHSESSYSSSSSSHNGHSYSYKTQTSHSPGYSYSYHSSGSSPLYSPGYATSFHSYTPLFLSSLDFTDFDLDTDLDTDLDFLIDTDLDLDLDLDFPGIEYGLGYIGKYGHWYRTPKYGFSKLYHNVDGDFWNYGARFGYDHLGPSHFGSLDFFR